MDIPKLNLPDFSKLKIPPHLSHSHSFTNSFKQPNMEMRDGGLTQIDDLDSRDFTNRLYESDRLLFLGSKDNITRVNGDIEIDPRKYKRASLTLESYEFTGIVNFLSYPEHLLDLGVKIVFKNCVFEKPLQFNNCGSQDTEETDFSQRSAAIEIVNGSYKILRISNCTLPFGVDIYAEEGEKLDIDWFESQNNHLKKAGYTFENVSFRSKVDITGDKIESMGVDFFNCNSNFPIRISSIKSPALVFKGKSSHFKNDIRIWGGEIESLVWNDGLFENEISISSVAIGKKLSIIGSEFQDKFSFQMKDGRSQLPVQNLPEEIWIQDSKFENGFEFSGDDFRMDKLTLVFSEKSSGVLEIKKTCFSEVNLKGNNFNNSVFLRDCSYDSLNFLQLFNKSLISLSSNNTQKGNANSKQLLIQNSNLGNTEFYDFDFSFYPNIRIIDSRLDNVFVNGVEWFKPSQLHVDEAELDPRKRLSQKREIYRQLKLAAEKQSDRITALKFKAREVETHNQLLGKEKVFSKLWFQRIGDIASIWAGTSNDHGQNWIKPFFLILGITTTMFPFLFIMADSEISIIPDWTVEGWSFFFWKVSDHGSIWIQLFNPARRVSDLFSKPLENPFGVYLLDAVQRIVLAFFIFQIVSAFRKFVK